MKPRGNARKRVLNEKRTSLNAVICSTTGHHWARFIILVNRSQSSLISQLVCESLNWSHDDDTHR
jgi:hypothetical protein